MTIRTHRMYRNSKSTSRLFCLMTKRVLSPSDMRSKISCWRISLSLRDIVRTYPCRSDRQYGHRSSAPQDACGPPTARPSSFDHRHGGQRLQGPDDAFKGRSAEVGLDPSTTESMLWSLMKSDYGEAALQASDHREEADDTPNEHDHRYGDEHCGPHAARSRQCSYCRGADESAITGLRRPVDRGAGACQSPGPTGAGRRGGIVTASMA